MLAASGSDNAGACLVRRSPCRRQADRDASRRSRGESPLPPTFVASVTVGRIHVDTAGTEMVLFVTCLAGHPNGGVLQRLLDIGRDDGLAGFHARMGQ